MTNKSINKSIHDYRYELFEKFVDVLRVESVDDL